VPTHHPLSDILSNCRELTGFCAVSSMLPLSQSVETEATLDPKDNGMNADFGEELHCIAAEPLATFVRVSVGDGVQEVAYETAGTSCAIRCRL
jgi:hypothetical protein